MSDDLQPRARYGVAFWRAHHDPLAAVHCYSPDRRAERPASHLAQFRGVVQINGYPGFARLVRSGERHVASSCNEHWQSRQ